MPYVITTSYRETDLNGRIIDEAFLSRTAVATLDEAREAARKITMDSHSYHGALNPFLYRIAALPDSGGTIGPLPDGTVIEVRQTDWHELIAANGGLCGHPITATDDAALAEVIETYNAR